jgi:MFS family permease
MNGTSGEEAPARPEVRRRTAVLFGVVFVDLLGLGILLPLVPFYGVRLGLSAETLTLVISLHALFQFLGAPLLGRLSDRHGRRPVLLFSMAGHAIAYLVLAFADSIWRCRGCCRASPPATCLRPTPTAPTCPARRTAPPCWRASPRRSPSASPSARSSARRSPDRVIRPRQTCSRRHLPPARFRRCRSCRYCSFCPRARADPTVRATRQLQRRRARCRRLRCLRQSLLLSLLVIVFSAMRETLFALWMHDKHGFEVTVTGAVIALHGLLVAAVQLFGTGRLSVRFGEQQLLNFGIVAYGASWLGLGLSTGLPAVLAAMTLSALGTALFATSLQSLLTQAVGPAVRGGVLGALQSSSALARFLGAALSGTLYGQISPDAPFLIGALAMIPAFFVGRRLRRNLAAQRVASGVTP